MCAARETEANATKEGEPMKTITIILRGPNGEEVGRVFVQVSK
jgi:hypothetical protein